MATAREIKKRIRSVKNISQITRALEAVSASRVRKAQARVLASRAYAEKAWEILLNVQSTATKGVPLHPLLTARSEIKQVMIVLITSDRGLAGAFNSNIIRVALRFAERLGKPARFVTIGKKGRDSLIRMGANVVAEFTGFPADPTIANIAPVARLAIDEFLSGQVDDVFIAYTDFVNTLTQRPVVLSWLPLIPYATEDQVMSEMIKNVPVVSAGKSDYEYEPNAAAILDEIVPRFTQLQLYQALLESQASEHSARMVAMRNASDNAGQLMSDLTLVYNKARQAAITAEILDIVGGAEALQASLESTADEILTSYYHVVAEASKSSNGHSAPMPRPAARSAAPQQVAVAEAVDDLTVIEGIGKKMSAALIASGIDTYAKLAEATQDTIHKAIEVAGLRFAPSIPTWAKQAEFAAKGDWDGLKDYQDKLTGGREA
ncbi:MAG: ATP synthase F1 subunit gamma [Anaerolineae bacterium]|nr:ATP synthase F1 subunit gamma [Anaerolineae bacterium]